VAALVARLAGAASLLVAAIALRSLADLRQA
jgi:hypothetical protein